MNDSYPVGHYELVESVEEDEDLDGVRAFVLDLENAVRGPQLAPRNKDMGVCKSYLMRDGGLAEVGQEELREGALAHIRALRAGDAGHPLRAALKTSDSVDGVLGDMCGNIE